MERFTLPEALQDTNEKLGENVHNIVRPLTDPTVSMLQPRTLACPMRLRSPHAVADTASSQHP